MTNNTATPVKRREVKFIQGYNCIDFPCRFDNKCTPNNSHGKHGLKIVFLVHGEEGCVQFVLSTGWTPFYSKPDKINYRYIPKSNISNLFPMPTDLGYHSRKPQYDGQTNQKGCQHLKGSECFYDGSSLNCNDAYYTLVNGGEEKLWEFLEKYYLCVFNNGKYPNVAEYAQALKSAGEI